jgi:hypothetical protein
MKQTCARAPTAVQVKLAHAGRAVYLHMTANRLIVLSSASPLPTAFVSTAPSLPPFFLATSHYGVPGGHDFVPVRRLTALRVKDEWLVKEHTITDRVQRASMLQHVLVVNHGFCLAAALVRQLLTQYQYRQQSQPRLSLASAARRQSLRRTHTTRVMSSNEHTAEVKAGTRGQRATDSNEHVVQQVPRVPEGTLRRDPSPLTRARRPCTPWRRRLASAAAPIGTRFAPCVPCERC